MPNYKSWPFKEASSLQRRFREQPNQPIILQTGFGPSGLPHIGTFAEVARTTWVRHAFEHLTGWPAKLVAFSDDMDGLRKVPLNMPEQKMLAENLGKPLCHIPDPFGCCESYSAHNNNKLQEFLDAYGFDYQFQSSQEAYIRGDFDEGLTILLEKVEEVQDIILPTLREDKRADWSPFFPICENCGRIYSTRVTGYHPEEKTIGYVCDKPVGDTPGCGHEGKTSALGGRVKVGWKVDWALRWFSYDVVYEMYGKDLIESAKLSGKITRLMGKQPPNGFFYELFLDEEGRKISKSVGKGLTVSANFSLINNLVSALGADDGELVIEYLERYDPAAKGYRDTLSDLVNKSLTYYRDFILPNKHYRPPTAQEKEMLQSIREQIATYQGNDEKELQTIPFDAARAFGVQPRDLFTAIYEVLLGQERGPRFGTFAKLVGKERMLALLDEALAK
ncbi:MAG: lysine--tRNA ligase [Anaerolineaceae bacterium 4572_5.1]|nr:MAG: lysine--tRNA ligase [Anaerolineaceae bacterium 4572_5.1]